MKEAFIWGAGHFGALAALDMEQKEKAIAGFLDSDKKLQGKSRLGYKVFSPEQVIKTSRGKQRIVIACWSYVNEMAEELKMNGYVYGKDFEIFEEIMANYGQIREQTSEYICKFDTNDITENKTEHTNEINDIEIYVDKSILLENEIILYGNNMGFTQIELCGTLRAIGNPVSYCCGYGNNSISKYVCDVELITYEKLKELDKQKPIVVIIASSDVVIMDKHIDEIKSLKLKTKKIYTEYAAIATLSTYRTERALKSQELVLIYTMPKVGSTTLFKSVTGAGIESVYAHTLKYLRKYIPNGRQIKIVTLVREPISRTFSHIFEGYEFYAGAAMSFESLFSKRFMEARQNFEWFDYELKQNFGIDVFSHPFDKKCGYSIIKQGNVEVFVIKLEMLNSLEPVIGEFIGASQFKLINANEGDAKAYKYQYKNIKDIIRIPRKIFDIVYNDNSKFDHFYSEMEKAEFIKKWKKNIMD